MRNNLPLIGYLLAFFFLIATGVAACCNDMKLDELRSQCHSKGGVWLASDRKCLDIKTIPLKEP